TGEEVSWKATKPDGSISQGILTNIKASKTTHTITRTAFDHQFGTWSIEYFHNDATAKVDVKVEQLTHSVTTNAQKYYNEDKLLIQFTTNYYEPSAANAKKVTFSILNNKGNPIKQFEDISFKVYQPQMTHQVPIHEIVKYNPYGKYKITATYFNIESNTEFEIVDPNASPSIFLGSDRKLYLPGNSIEISIGLNKLPEEGGVLKIISPSGKEVAKKIIEITNTMTKVTIRDDILKEIGTYTYQFEYANSVAKNYFDVLIESLDDPQTSGLNLGILLNQEQYRPGQKMIITVSTSKLIENNLTYWFESPSGVPTEKYSFVHSSGDNFTITHVLPINTEPGSWKLFVKYGQAVKSHTFFVEKSISTSSIFIPDWIKNNARWWNLNQISDSEFAQGIEFMIREKIITIPNLVSGNTSSDVIPNWIKNNAGWWAQGIISDQEFADSIEFLVKNGIIQVG
ncbi:MAG: hypothetical protein R3327_02540, partial [Nitrosopumilaceae archaeon]|nr:hypothetical protein [Nitrosopumilaceae archaeon]